MAGSSARGLGRALGYVGAGLSAWRVGRGGEVVRARAARHLEERLGRLRGLPQKLGQLLSMSAEEDLRAPLASLQGAAEPLPLAEVLPWIEEAFGRDPREVLRSIEPRGLAASLGQVHRAELDDGRVVAIKVRYPGIEDAIETDLKALGWIARPLGNLRRGFDLEAYRGALRDGLDEELDYLREAENQRDLAQAARGLSIVVPDVVPELSNERVLTTIWEDGETLEDVRAWSPEERGELGRELLNQFLVLAFERGILHCDPHPGNYRFRRSEQGPTVVLYDFGCVYRLERNERLALLSLIAQAVADERQADPYPYFVEAGFDAEVLEPLRTKLPALARVVFEPFGARGKYDLARWNRGARVADVLGPDRLNFRIAGPARLLYLLRAFQGLLHYLAELGEPVAWGLAATPVLARQAAALASFRPETPPDPATTYGTLARHLCIRVQDGDREKARITLPAGAVERLDSFLDDDLATKIEARSIDVKAVVAQARAGGYAPQELFVLEEEARSFAVWLE